MRWRVAALAAIAALLAGACSPAPSPPPSAGASVPAGTADALAGLLRGAIDPDAIMADLGRLQEITDEAGGTRYAGGQGEANAAAFAVRELVAAGLVVTRHEVNLPVYRQVGPGALEVAGPNARAFEPLIDFKPLLFSPSGDVSGPVVAVDFDRAAAPDSTTGGGCDSTDWASFPRGAIALVQPGSCYARDVVLNAQAAGAAAVVRSYPGWTAGHVLRPTLIDPGGVTIPAVAVTHAAGLALDAAAEDGAPVRVAVDADVTTVTAASVLAETPGGDPARVVMVGGHLDSVIDGPGINDNGSGAMTIVEIGRELGALAEAGHAPAWKVRLALWTGEEIGTWGSFAWLDTRTPEVRSAIAAYLNLDMLGSPNGVREIYRWSADGSPASDPLERLFERAFELEGLSSQRVQVGSSDDLAFAQAGIPTSGLFSGHSTLKTVDQARLFGGVVGEPLDPCYHLACDTVANVDPMLLGQMARATGWVTGHLAGGGIAAP